MVDGTDMLLRCLNTYELLMEQNYIYEIEGGISFPLIFKKENLVHLLGLHKLKDIRDFSLLETKSGQAKILYRNIKNKKLKYSDIEKSVHFDEIKDRIETFTEIKDLLFEKVIIQFNPKLINSNLKSNMIFYSKKNNIYLHLCIYNKGGVTYPESFFPRANRHYINNQIHRDVKNVKVEKFNSKKKKK